MGYKVSCKKDYIIVLSKNFLTNPKGHCTMKIIPRVWTVLLLVSAVSFAAPAASLGQVTKLSMIIAGMGCPL